MKKRTVTKNDILTLSIATFIVTLAWVGFTIYHTLTTSTISSEIQQQLTPISGQFDMQTIQQLKTRDQVIPLFENQIQQIASEEAEEEINE